jgi:hypothetical protein
MRNDIQEKRAQLATDKNIFFNDEGRRQAWQMATSVKTASGEMKIWGLTNRKGENLTVMIWRKENGSWMSSTLNIRGEPSWPGVFDEGTGEEDFVKELTWWVCR